MDEVESRIFDILSSFPEGLGATQITERYNRDCDDQVNLKRIRRKADSMCNFKILSKTQVKTLGKKGPKTNIYTIYTEESQ